MNAKIFLIFIILTISTTGFAGELAKKIKRISFEKAEPEPKLEKNVKLAQAHYEAALCMVFEAEKLISLPNPDNHQIWSAYIQPAISNALDAYNEGHVKALALAKELKEFAKKYNCAAGQVSIEPTVSFDSLKLFTEGELPEENIPWEYIDANRLQTMARFKLFPYMINENINEEKFTNVIKSKEQVALDLQKIKTDLQNSLELLESSSCKDYKNTLQKKEELIKQLEILKRMEEIFNNALEKAQ